MNFPVVLFYCTKFDDRFGGSCTGHQQEKSAATGLSLLLCTAICRVHVSTVDHVGICSGVCSALIAAGLVHLEPRGRAAAKQEAPPAQQGVISCCRVLTLGLA